MDFFSWCFKDLAGKEGRAWILARFLMSVPAILSGTFAGGSFSFIAGRALATVLA